MPEENTLDLEKVRLLPLENIGTAEIAFLNEHKAELDAEEKAAFVGFLTPDPEVIAAPVIPEPETPTPPVTPAPAINPDEFIKKEEMASYIEDKRKEWEAANVSKAEQDKKEAEIKQLYKEGELPTDWNDFGNKVIDSAVEKVFAQLNKQNEDAKAAAAATEKEREKVLAGFQAEFATLEKDGKIPNVGTEEGKKVMEQIFKVGMDNGKVTVTEAYALWSQLPEEFGGGYKTGNTAEKQRLNKQKEAAGKVGGGTTAPPATEAWIKPEERRKLSMDQLLDRRQEIR